jgi:glycosyltransferase involved in cell wall biosynthesis
MPLVSVVIPTIRRAKLVAEAINSVLVQTVRDFEIIVVIDGQDPETSAALTLIPDRRLRVIQNQTSLGPGSARNAGAAVARSPWIAFLDDDDAWLPQKLELQLAAAKSHEQRVIVTCLSQVITPRGLYIWPRRIYDNIAPLDEYLFDRRSLFSGDTNFHTSSILMPYRLFNEFKFTAEWVHEDWEMLVRATKIGGAEVITVREPLVIVSMEEERESLSTKIAWPDSLRWIDRNRTLISRRAYSGFCLTILAPEAARAGEYTVFFTMLWRAYRLGRPRPMHLLIYIAFGLIPIGWRRHIRSVWTRTSPKIKT